MILKYILVAYYFQYSIINLYIGFIIIIVNISGEQLVNSMDERGTDNLTIYSDEIFSLINSKQQIAYHEINDNLHHKIPKEDLDTVLKNLELSKKIASRSNGGILTYYSLLDKPLINKILIVEDDKNINRLMALSVGKGFDIRQVYDGAIAINEIKKDKPNLIILDLMLPNIDGLQICQIVKSDPDLSDITVILVSAMDPTSNRFKGIKYGADYYIKKPFDPAELRSLVTLFLKKKGKRFDPLIDLPDEDRISEEIERSLNKGEKYKIGILSIENLGSYASRFGEHSAIVILRLISQLLQDIIKNKTQNLFVGFLNNESFVIAGMEEDVNNTVKEIKNEFAAVLPFIVQDVGYKQIDLNLDNLFETNEVPKLSLKYEEAEKEKIKERRERILEDRTVKDENISSYTYDELQKLFGREDFDVIITRDASGIRLRVGKVNSDGSNKKDDV